LTFLVADPRPPPSSFPFHAPSQPVCRRESDVGPCMAPKSPPKITSPFFYFVFVRTRFQSSKLNEARFKVKASLRFFIFPPNNCSYFHARDFIKGQVLLLVFDQGRSAMLSLTPGTTLSSAGPPPLQYSRPLPLMFSDIPISSPLFF